MADTRHHWRSFGGGEVTPEFFGRIDDTKFQTGLALCRNFLVKPQGPIQNRPGTRFVRFAKNAASVSRLLPFVYAFDQQLVIEFGVGAFRFHALGQTIESSPGVAYEVAHTYTADELFEVTYAQSGDLIRLRHKNHPRRTLTRTGATSWALTDDALGSTLAGPANLVGTPTAGSTPGTPFDTDYVVTAVTAAGDESLQSATETVSNNLYDDGAYNDLTWDAVTGAERYNVYKRSTGLFGFIGQTDQLEFRDENIAPDIGTTPPLDIDLFDSATNYPGAVSYFEQRLFEGGSLTQPQNIWGTKSGTEYNFNYSIPAKDNDSLQFKIAARENNGVIHLVAMGDLLAMTQGNIWKISGGSADILTPLTIGARQQTFIGAGQARPALSGNNMVYVASRGGHLREMGFDGDSGTYLSGDLSVRAPHLFDGFNVRSISPQVAPYPIIWATSTSGKLIGLTYIPEQQIGAFHQHDTLGEFEDVTTINEDGRDVVYAVVKRTLLGATCRTIEYFADRLQPDSGSASDQYFVDCGATYDGVPTSTITGLTWLVGQEVAILADGGVVSPRTVNASGEVELDEEASVVHVGLPYTSDAQTLPLAVELAGYGQGQPKNVSQVFLRVYKSGGINVGPTFDELTPAKLRNIEPMGSPVDLKTGMVDIVIDGAWEDDGQICLRQSDPLALTVLSLTVDFALGGG